MSEPVEFELPDINPVNSNPSLKLPLIASANWEDSRGDYGIIYCLGSMKSSKISGTDFQAYCDGENQENDKFWLHFIRKSDDMDVGIGESKYINGTGKYEKLIGISCPYAVKFFKDRTFFKKKCNID